MSFAYRVLREIKKIRWWHPSVSLAAMRDAQPGDDRRGIQVRCPLEAQRNQPWERLLSHQLVAVCALWGVPRR